MLLTQQLKSYFIKGKLRFFKPGPYFLFEIRLSTHREQFGEDRHPLRAILITRDRHISI